jgi:hypothetical protein
MWVVFFLSCGIYNNNKNMKHLLNNLTDEEKNTIREQHEGGMKIMNENFHKMVNKKLGHVDTYNKDEE